MLLSAFAASARAQGVDLCTGAPVVLDAPTPAAFERFGEALAFDGTHLVVGAPGDDQLGGDVGAAYVYVRRAGAFAFETQLLPPVAQPGMGFGGAVAVEGGRVLVGAPGRDGPGTDAGAAFVFASASGWGLEAELVPADLEAADLFGAACALDGGVAVVGAPGEDAGAFSGGAAYAFLGGAGGWSEDAKLLPTDPALFARFGASVALDGDTLVVGAVLDPAGGFSAGAAYAFVRSAGTWTEEAKLVSPSPQAFARAGAAVDVAGDVALVGAPGRDGSRGAAETFERSGGVWTHVTTAQPLGLVGGEGYGSSVSVEGARAVVGGTAEARGGPGGAFVLRRGAFGWEVRGSLTTPASGAARVGAACALVDGVAALGAPGEASAGMDAGAAYLVALGATARPVGAGTAGAGGFVPDLVATGCVGVDPTWTFDVSGGAGGALGFLLLGRDEVSVPVVGVELLVGGPLFTIEAHVLAGACPGTGSWSRTFQWPAPPTTLRLVGQALYQDAGAAAGWSASGGVRVDLP